MTTAEFVAAVWAACEQPLAERDYWLSYRYIFDRTTLEVSLLVRHGKYMHEGSIGVPLLELQYMREPDGTILYRVRRLIQQVDASIERSGSTDVLWQW